MPQEVFEFYVKRAAELTKAGKWLIAYAKLYNKYEGDNRLYWKIRLKGERAVKRLERLL